MLEDLGGKEIDADCCRGVWNEGVRQRERRDVSPSRSCHINPKEYSWSTLFLIFDRREESWADGSMQACKSRCTSFVQRPVSMPVTLSSRGHLQMEENVLPISQEVQRLLVGNKEEKGGLVHCVFRSLCGLEVATVSEFGLGVMTMTCA